MTRLMSALLERRSTVYAACLASLALGLFFIFVWTPLPWGWKGIDDYGRIAMSLARGEPFPTVHLVWGYAYFLAVFHARRPLSAHDVFRGRGTAGRRRLSIPSEPSVAPAVHRRPVPPASRAVGGAFRSDGGVPRRVRTRWGAVGHPQLQVDGTVHP